MTSGFAASASLSTAAIVTSPVLVVAFAAKLRAVFELSPTPSAGETDTVTVNGAAWASGTVAVTVVFPPFSSIAAGVSASSTRGFVSFRRLIRLMR